MVLKVSKHIANQLTIDLKSTTQEISHRKVYRLISFYLSKYQYGERIVVKILIIRKMSRLISSLRLVFWKD